MFRKFISYYKPHKKLFFLDLFCALLIALCDLFYPNIAKLIINDYVPDRNLRMLIIWSGALFLIYVVKLFLNYIVTYYGHIVGVRMQADMRRDLFRHLQKTPFAYFDETKTGVITSRLINDLFEVSELAHHAPEDLFISIILLIGSFIILSSINLQLTLIIFAVIPLIIFFAIKMRRGMSSAFRKSREQISEVNAEIETAISGIRVSRAYTAENHENAKFDKENGLFKVFRSAAYRQMGIFHSGMVFFTDILYLVVLLSGGLFFFNGKIDIGEFAAFLLYIHIFLTPINRFVALFEQLQEGMTGFKRFLEMMAIEPEQEADNAIELVEPKAEIVFDNVTFSYSSAEEGGSKNEVISNLSMTIPAGKTVALVGPSGGGKTTICNLIPRFYEIQYGKIMIDGLDITKLTRHSLRKNIGVVSQDVFLFNGTIKENIAYGDIDASDDRIIEAAKNANIHDFIMSLPKGYDTSVGERGVKLSGGQKQRVSIARVFLKNPNILILDEATSALDNTTEMQIQAALERLSEGRTVIVVAHRLSTVRNADEIVVITSDGIIEKGSHEELLVNENGMYKKLYSYQLR
ncbi:MAG: ABC transporter ATP-binding protein [Eubacteriales bacterium]|nr:ABC transporter ATP-binding protein [Eubacteriales bacterium]